jgi:5-methylcytosine-specific restriction endonuclease McrA
LKALSRHRALVLDSSYRPIDVVNWQRAICMALLDKADVLEYYESTVCSVSAEFFLPAVMRARTYFGGKVGRLGSVALNRRNIFLRDNFRCQYCGRRGTSNLTIDHVIPQCKGGTNTWTNLVTACPPCNTRKGDKSLKQLKWKLLSQPRKPSPWEMNLILAAVGVQSAGSLPPEWANYLVTRNGSLSDLEDLDD